jgi:hypothetical protein
MIQEQSRDIGTRPSKAPGIACRDRVSFKVECHDRDRTGCIPRGLECRGAEREDEVYLSLNKFRGESRECLGLSTRRSDLEHYRLALDEADVKQTGSKGGDCGGLASEARVQNTHHRDFPSRLRLAGERRGEEAAGDCCQERAPVHHSIT